MVYGVKKKKTAATKSTGQNKSKSNTPSAIGGIAKSNAKLANNAFKAPSTPVKRPQIIGRGTTG